MIDANYIKANLEQVKKNLAKKGFNLEQSKFEKLYSNRKELITKHESLLSEKNIISKDIGLLKSNNKDASSLLLKVESINKEMVVDSPPGITNPSILSRSEFNLTEIDSIPIFRRILRCKEKPPCNSRTPTLITNLSLVIYLLELSHSYRVLSLLSLILC